MSFRAWVLLFVSIAVHSAAADVTSAPLGAVISINAEQPGDGVYWYRFRVREAGGQWRTVRDYGPKNSLDWTAIDHEGSYEMEVSARNIDTGETTDTFTPIALSALTNGDQPAVTPTSHPLVFLFSAPPCEGSMFAVFTGPDGKAHQTPPKDCTGLTMNFYLAGLYANTDYAAHTVSAKGSGLDVRFTTGDAPGGLFTQTVVREPAAGASSEQVLLGTSSSNGAMATDLAGRVIWTLPPGPLTFLTRAGGGLFWAYLEDTNGGPENQTLTAFDLTGMVVTETNAARVNEQLAAMGKRLISGFHHEVRTLPGGRIVALAGVEQILTDVQGEGPVDVLGDMIVVLDRDLKVVWTWDAFDHLDVNRKAVLGETCSTGGGCAMFFLSKDPNDWTHGNAVQLTPDGQLLYSARHQDWLIKIAFDDGAGDGHIIWRLGKDGDFRLNSDDPYPWFSHQHDGSILATDPSKVLVFDNGNTRVAANGRANSRGQMLRLDEENRTATLVVNANLGAYSPAVGSAAMLSNGNLHFNAGFVFAPVGIDAWSIEVDLTGRVVYRSDANSILYRTFRLTDLYSALH